ncbi:tetratricopeptide repeat protein [Sphingobium sp.]|uniref:tetratricopeptide repeat protein n=1 Tax=Sphingobium sp. TaxID=1912891 RepID=UPI002CC66016|nr:tetratricopeptide repeat protein [Sphingobium sp.]HUD93722.1 tetratricopeptide repeat protein [Sphingobium sp.]
MTRPPGAADLNGHLSRLAANPKDVAALIGAGEAALELDDPHGAAGFFARADAIESGNGRIKAGLARVMLKLQNPVEAVRLFDQASRLGFPDATILADRGLARDMTGDQAGAQRDYHAALVRTPEDAELIRRYAASLGISGQVQAADKVLEPLLYKSDRAAWRYRAFIYAMNNRQADAKKVAEQTMPVQLAAAITPYMQKMPYLTAPQKAAAVHFGQFPQTTGTTIAAITPTPPAPGIAVAPKAPTVVATAPTTPPVQTKPLSRAEQRRQQRDAARMARAEGRSASRAAPTAQRPPVPTTRSPQVAQAQTAQPTPRPVQQAPAPSPLSATQPQQTTAAPPPRQPAAPAPSAASTSVQGPPAPGFESIDSAPRSAAPPASTGSQLNAIALAQAGTPPQAPAMPPQQPTPQQPAAEPEPQLVQPIEPVPPSPNAEATRTLADIIRAIDVPDSERQATVAAVDLNEVAALQAQRRAERQAAAKAAADKAKKEATAKAKAEADAKAKAEAEEKKRLAANPSRNWLQVGVGQSKGALGFTMKGLRKKYALLSHQDGWSASWGRTNRLLVGPFASFTRAKQLETDLKKDGADVFAWKSDAGEEVEKLPGE